MSVFESLYAMMEGEWITADPAGVLRAVEKAGISLQNVHVAQGLRLSFSVRKKDWKKLEAIAIKRGDALTIKGRHGLYWQLMGLTKRPVLLLGLAFLLFLSLWVPTRIFFVQVEGNSRVYTNQILEEAAACGIRFGASRKAVRSEVMKNALLERMPQLSWAGVNTSGCVAVITVEESEEEQKTHQNSRVSSMVALIDGVIRDVTVTKGTAWVKEGQRVKTGDVLISGFTDTGTFLRATKADGEVFADTIRNLTAYCPFESLERGEQQEVIVTFGILVGKNRINFKNSSGISDTGCVRIYLEKYITLPGGFVLPVGIYQEKWISYQMQPSAIAPDRNRLETDAQQYLLSQMIGGKILVSNVSFAETGQAFRMDGIYGCCEMIGISRAEEYLLDYEDH